MWQRMAMMMMHFIIWNLFLFYNMEIKIHTHWEGKEEKKREDDDWRLARLKTEETATKYIII